MKIAILGTRGIPNYHGGFEQFAEYFAKFLVDKGHEVCVYSSSLHPYKKDMWNGVEIIHKYDPENKIGSSGQFIYDLNCIWDSRSRRFDVVLQLGYTSSSIWNWLFPKATKIVTNMDGLEWKRSKYSSNVQKFLKYAEKLAINHSHVLIADSIGIQAYLQKEYEVSSTYIAYGVLTDNAYNKSILNELKLVSNDYNMLIARMEPENNIEVILDGVVESKRNRKFIVIGKTDNTFGSYLVDKYKNDNRIEFLGAIYDLPKLNSLRSHSNMYFHGHSVGGTNPSLLEAMASHAFICAHNNVFNKSILEDRALYFDDASDVAKVLDEDLRKQNARHVEKNYQNVTSQFNWTRINEQYLHVLNEVIKSL